jgi:hypothetical protein
MNERIKLLAGKALDKTVPYTWHNLDHVEVEKVMTEFAELIVRECAETVLGFRNQFGDSAHAEIKQHFGVEDATVNDVDRILQTVRTRGQ